jgi:hypothetical protein
VGVLVSERALCSASAYDAESHRGQCDLGHTL